ncbi:MAG: DUF4331 family protein [Candidatus Acidiferrum sp.]|jgi:hypothetical protein
MSHHFDTKLAKEEPSLNVSDLYLFDGPMGTTVMVMTVNPDVGLSAPDTLHVEGLYAFRFDLNADAREELAFKFRFSEPGHAEGDEHVHMQKFQVLRATGNSLGGLLGDVLLEGETEKINGKSGVRAFAGIAADMFAPNGSGMRAFLNAFYNEQRYDASVFQHGQNSFANRNVTAIVLEVPNEMIGRGRVHCWATASLVGHAPELQVQRWGLPLITHFFPNDPDGQEMKDRFNASQPSDDVALFSRFFFDFSEKMTTHAMSAANPAEYARQIAARLCPVTLPYELGTPAAFNLAGFNGRPLGDDVMDVMLTLVSNTPIEDGAVPDRKRIRSEFPYVGRPYTKEEQVGVPPIHPPPKQ